MHWYDGNIAEAVNLSKQRNAIFVVFVEGENELSTEMATTLGNSDIASKLSDPENFLAVKLKSGSVDYTHFAQIYQFVPVPSLFFIGRNGTPLEVVCAGVEPTNLATRIDRILSEHYNDSPPIARSKLEPSEKLLQSEADAAKPDGPSTSQKTLAPADTPETSSGPAAKIAKTEHHEVTRSGQEYEVVCDGDICVRKPKKSDDPGPSHIVAPDKSSTTTVQFVPEVSLPEIDVSVEDKVERAKELIEAKKREKEDKEKDLARQKELERRAAGQGVAELKRWQADQELKQIQEERKREKLENKLARQRILEQIAQDRAERRARDTPTTQAAPATTNTTSGDAASSARIQFKMPDGASHTAHFNAEDTLRDVRRYVADNLQLRASSFTLWTAFPRRELTETDWTLRRLELAPSAALLVLARPHTPSAAVVGTSSVNNFISFITTLFTSLFLEPTQNVWNWIRSRFIAPTAASSDPAPREESPPRPTAPGLRYRPRTNVHRLTGDRPTDDDNNTWNGNSTQQM